MSRWIPPRISGVPDSVHQVFQGLSRWLDKNIPEPAETIPIATVVAFAGAAAPAGWVFCNGQSLLRASYPDLFNAIGTTWGSLDSNSFSVPDLRGRAPIGAGPGGSLTPRTLGTTGGAEDHTLSVSEIPGHTHPQYVSADSGNGTAVRSDYDADVTNGGSFPQGISTGTTGGGTAHNNMPPWAAVNYIIKALD